MGSHPVPTQLLFNVKTQSTLSPGTKICLLEYFENVMATLSEARDKLQDILVINAKKPEPTSYNIHVSLDPNMLHTNLLLSKH